MPTDYEAEYNNRARVPEHPEIFARWAREAEDYRAEAMKERRAELGLQYGDTPRQTIDLFSPKRAAEAPRAAWLNMDGPSAAPMRTALGSRWRAMTSARR